MIQLRSPSFGEFDTLPVAHHWRQSNVASWFILLFSLPWIVGILGFVSYSVAQGRWEALLLIFALILPGAMFALGLLVRNVRGELRIDDRAVFFEQSNFFGNTAWSVPLREFSAIYIHKSYRSSKGRGRGIPEFEVRFLHPDDRKSLTLFATLKHGEAQRVARKYGKLFALPVRAVAQH